MKNILLMEAKAANAGMKFIIRDTAQVGEHAEQGFAYLRRKQGRDACLERNGVGDPPHEEGYSKEAVKSVAYSSSSGSLFNFGQLCFLVPRPCAPTSDLP